METYKNKAIKLIGENTCLNRDSVLIEILLEYKGIDNFYIFFEEYINELSAEDLNHIEELILRKLKEMGK